MTSTDTVRIVESLDDLKSMEQRHLSAGNKKRLQFLMMLKESGGGIEELGEALGKSSRTLYRWLEQYRAGGLAALLGEKKQHSTRIGARELSLLREELIVGEMESLQDIQGWLKERFGLEYSIRGVSDLVNRRLGAKRVWRVEEVKPVMAVPVERSETSEIATFDASDDSFLHLMNNMPVDFDVKNWIEQFRDLLQGLFDDVDRITVNVNTSCQLLKPENYHPDFTIAQDAQPLNGVKEGVWVERHDQDHSPSEGLLKSFAEQGYPLEKYHSPCFFDYYFKDMAYLGTIFLWRYKELEKVSPATLLCMEKMARFITFALSDLVVRHHYANPNERAFYDALLNMGSEAGLSSQERRAVSYRLLGYAYKEIADKLHVTQDSVKKLLQSVYRKTETRAHVELFAKYFTPRIVPQKDS